MVLPPLKKKKTILSMNLDTCVGSYPGFVFFFLGRREQYICNILKIQDNKNH